MKSITPSELKARLDQGEKIIVIDVREPYELDICSMSVAEHIPMADIASREAEIPHDIPVVIMCKSGRRAEAVTNLLMNDYERLNVLLLEGGIMAWIEEVEPHLESY